MHWGRIHRVKDLPWLVWGQLFDGFGIFFLWGFITILSASEDSRSLMGGSDVVHCVRVPLTGTTVAEFWACGSLVGIGSHTITYYVYNIMDIGGPSIIVV